jgi:MHS family proline/betaine transporter-like MFS transporter
LKLADLYKFNLTREEFRIVVLAALGGMLEFYDFSIYGIFSLYFAHQFFPSGNPLMTIIESYVVFVLGYFARPIGGIIFSHIGDEYGRKRVLIITVLLMGLSSFGIGMLPTYSQIGISAPILLLMLRLSQGLALGGELPSTYVYISESISGKLGTGFGITMAGVNSGLLIAMFVNQGITTFFTDVQIASFAWRIPFILGGLLCIISYKIRKNLQETTSFIQIMNKVRFPLIYFVRYHPRLFFTGFGLVCSMSSFIIVTIVFMPTYLHQIIKIDIHLASHMMLWVLVINVITIFIVGMFANFINPKLLLKGALLVGVALAIPSYHVVFHKVFLLPALILLGMIEGMCAALVPLLLSSIFPTNVRLTGVALSYNTCFTLVGAMAPVLITTMIHHGANPAIVPATYLIIFALVSLFSVFCIRKR